MDYMTTEAFPLMKANTISHNRIKSPGFFLAFIQVTMILDFVKSSHIHGLYVVLKSSNLLLQHICSNLIVFNYTLYLKFLNSVSHWNQFGYKRT